MRSPTGPATAPMLRKGLPANIWRRSLRVGRCRSEGGARPREGQRSIRALIEGMDPEQAQALLLRLAERDTAVAEQIRSATEPSPNNRSSAEKADRPTAAPDRRGAWVYRVRPGLGYDV